MSDARPNVALLGTGLMGSGIARCLLREGMPVRVWNRSRAKAQALASAGAVVCDEPQQAVKDADILITMLLDGPATLRTVGTDGALLELLAPDAVWIQCGTVGVDADELRALADTHRVSFVDAPVLGTPNSAEEGRLGIIASGPPAAAPRVTPIFDAIGFQTLWLGEGTEASRLKLAITSWILASTLAVAEAMALTEALGVDPAMFLKAIEGGRLDTTYARLKGQAIIDGRYTPTLTVATAAKDASLVVSAGRAAGAVPRVAEAVLAQYQRAAELGHADKDLAAAYFAAAASSNRAATDARRSATDRDPKEDAR